MNRTACRLAATLALLSTSQLQAAAPTHPCITPAELRGMVAYVLPSAMTTLIERCRPGLPAGASLLGRGGQLVAEFEASGRLPSRWRAGPLPSFRMSATNTLPRSC